MQGERSAKYLWCNWLLVVAEDKFLDMWEWASALIICYKVPGKLTGFWHIYLFKENDWNFIGGSFITAEAISFFC